jgi:hypothetical protein
MERGSHEGTRMQTKRFNWGPSDKELGGRMRKPFSMIITSLLLTTISMLALTVPLVKTELTNKTTLESTVIRVEPETISLGYGPVIGEEFTIAVVIENIAELYGTELNFTWDDEYLEYVSHTKTIPIDAFPEPIPPSPYAGILHSPTLLFVDEVSGNSYHCADCTLHHAGNFSGSGTAFVMTLRVKNQSDSRVEVPLTFHETLLAHVERAPGLIDHSVRNGSVIIPGLLDEYPGDIDEDGDVDIYDITIMTGVYGTEEGEAKYDPRCDLDANKRINILDIVIAADNYGKRL